MTDEQLSRAMVKQYEKLVEIKQRIHAGEPQYVIVKYSPAEGGVYDAWKEMIVRDDR